MSGNAKHACLIVVLSISVVVFSASRTIGSALLNGTSHYFEYGSVEPAGWCGSLCHAMLEQEIAVYGEIEQAWATSLTGGSGGGMVAAMCASCHHSSGAYSDIMHDATSDQNVYHPYSHGQRMVLSDQPSGTDAVNSGLPYIDNNDSYFECSTCHDVHDDNFRPFMRDSMETICVRCHANRKFVEGVESHGLAALPGNWGPKISRVFPIQAHIRWVRMSTRTLQDRR